MRVRLRALKGENVLHAARTAVDSWNRTRTRENGAMYAVSTRGRRLMA